MCATDCTCRDPFFFVSFLLSSTFCFSHSFPGHVVRLEIVVLWVQGQLNFQEWMIKQLSVPKLFPVCSNWINYLIQIGISLSVYWRHRMTTVGMILFLFVKGYRFEKGEVMDIDLRVFSAWERRGSSALRKCYWVSRVRLFFDIIRNCAKLKLRLEFLVNK